MKFPIGLSVEAGYWHDGKHLATLHIEDGKVTDSVTIAACDTPEAAIAAAEAFVKHPTGVSVRKCRWAESDGDEYSVQILIGDDESYALVTRRTESAARRFAEKLTERIKKLRVEVSHDCEPPEPRPEPKAPPARVKRTGFRLSVEQNGWGGYDILLHHDSQVYLLGFRKTRASARREAKNIERQLGKLKLESAKRPHKTKPDGGSRRKETA